MKACKWTFSDLKVILKGLHKEGKGLTGSLVLVWPTQLYFTILSSPVHNHERVNSWDIIVFYCFEQFSLWIFKVLWENVCVCVCVFNQTWSAPLLGQWWEIPSACLLTCNTFLVNEAIQTGSNSKKAVLPTELQRGTMKISFVHYNLILHLSGVVLYISPSLHLLCWLW